MDALETPDRAHVERLRMREALVPAEKPGLSQYLVPIGRLCFSAIFLESSLQHFSRRTIDYAAQHGVRMASVLVPLSGVLALLGGLSVLLGYRARVGGAILVLFLVPVTLSMHNFWAISDPAAADIQKIMFFKNVSMLGGALLVIYHGAGPLSIDAKRRRD